MKKTTTELLVSRRELLCSAVVMAAGYPFSSIASSRWREAASLPLKVQEIYPCLHGGEIWVAGGLTPDVSDFTTDRVVRYSVYENQWHAAPSLPEPRHHGYLISTVDELFLFGGFVSANGGRWSSTRDVLKLEGDNWLKIGTMPEAQMETVAAVANERIHFAGGRAPSANANSEWQHQGDVATHQVFDPQSLKTTSAPPLPMARNSAASFVIDNDWHVVGGRTVKDGNTAQHDIFNFEDNRWHNGPPLPQAQGGLAAASVGKNGYVFGGEYFTNGSGVYSEVWHYDSDAERWYDAGTMPVPRHGLGAVAVGNDIYVIAGATEAGGRGTSDRLSIFSP